MSTIIVLFIISYLQGTYSQYYGYPSASLYQPYYYLSGETPVLPYYTYALLGYPASCQPPTFAPSITITQPMCAPTTFPSSASPGLPAPQCRTPTATAYYLTTGSKPLKTIVAREVEKPSLPKSIIAKEKENSPTYSCSYCNDFKNVPKNPKLPPPLSPSAVLPGLFDKIPLIECKCKPKEIFTIPINGLKETCELKDKLTSSSLLSENLKKLTGKLKFDEDLLDGFLTGIGLKT